MFTLCPECKQHYEDSFESKKCSGPSTNGHPHVNTSPIHEHLRVTHEARITAALGGRGDA